MVTKLFDPEEFNAAFKNLKIFSDGQGEDKITSEGFASMNFDGLIPVEVDNFPAASIVPGMHISLTGSGDGVTFYQVTSVTESDSDLTASPTQVSYIEYLDDNEEVNILETSSSNVYSIFYENWDDKYLGTTGWYISSEGNAIFSNVAIRGRVEAIEGTLNNIIAESGSIKELDIGGNYYPVENIWGVPTSSATTLNDKGGLDRLNSGQFLMKVPRKNEDTFEDYRLLFSGERFRLHNVPSSGSYLLIDWLNTSTILTSSSVFNTRCIVITASYGFDYADYHCKIDQSTVPGEVSINNPNFYDLFSVSASSGSFNIGYMILGEESGFLIGDNDLGYHTSVNEGIVFINESSSDSQRDFMDISGRFSLASGKMNFNGESLYVEGNINPIFSINSQSSSFYALLESDAGKLVEMNSASANTLYIRSEGYLSDFLVGNKIDVVQTGVGTTTIASASGVTINSVNSKVDISAQYGVVSLLKTGEDTWLLSGDLA